MLAIYFPNELCSGTMIGMLCTAVGMGTATGIGISSLLVYYLGDFLIMILLSATSLIVGFIIFCTVSSITPFWAQEDFESDGVERIFSNVWEKSLD